ncbi:MAG TPA: sterol desaturase family protein, partial [Candidatus Binatia bacterium]|nr:sterol desaturase family protein [Candidatus Binatia bacterium]
MDAVILWSIPVFIFSIAAEWLYARRSGLAAYAEPRDTWANLAMGLGNVVISAVMKTVILGAYFLAYRFRPFEIPPTAAWAWLLLLFADDLCYYAFHRMHHRVRLLWCTHVNHHSSERFNFAVALRQPWTEPLTAPWFWLPLPLLGFH